MQTAVWYLSPLVLENGEPVTLRQIRRRCDQIARDVTVPDPFDLTAFLAEVSHNRGRQIILVPFDMPAGAPRGVCVASDTVDYVVVDNAASGEQRTHIALHEVSHLLLGHQLRVVDLLRHLFQHLDLDVLQARLAHARTGYTTVEEQEAEMLASLIGQRAGLWRERSPQTPTDPLIQRLGLSLEHGTGRDPHGH